MQDLNLNFPTMWDIIFLKSRNRFGPDFSLDVGLDFSLDVGLYFGLDIGPDFGLDFCLDFSLDSSELPHFVGLQVRLS